jgi:hypothetical protein
MMADGAQLLAAFPYIGPVSIPLYAIRPLQVPPQQAPASVPFVYHPVIRRRELHFSDSSIARNPERCFALFFFCSSTSR